MYKILDKYVLSDSIPDYAALYAETNSFTPPKTLLKMIFIDLFNYFWWFF